MAATTGTAIRARQRPSRASLTKRIRPSPTIRLPMASGRASHFCSTTSERTVRRVSTALLITISATFGRNETQSPGKPPSQIILRDLTVSREESGEVTFHPRPSPPFPSASSDPQKPSRKAHHASLPPARSCHNRRSASAKPCCFGAPHTFACGYCASAERDYGGILRAAGVGRITHSRGDSGHCGRGRLCG